MDNFALVRRYFSLCDQNTVTFQKRLLTISIDLNAADQIFIIGLDSIFFLMKQNFHAFNICLGRAHRFFHSAYTHYFAVQHLWPGNHTGTFSFTCASAVEWYIGDFRVCREPQCFNVHIIAKLPKTLARDIRDHLLQLPKNCDLFMGRWEGTMVCFMGVSPSLLFSFFNQTSKFHQFFLH